MFCEKAIELPTDQSTVICPCCGEVVPRKCSWQKTCGSRPCRDHLHWLEQRESPAHMATMRARNTANYAKRKGGEWEESPWLKGAPIYGSHLLGGGMIMSVDPLFGAVEHRHIRMLHGVVSSVLGLEGHGRPVPDFSLLPWPSPLGWALYVGSTELAERVAKSNHFTHLFSREVTLKLGPLFRLRSPTITKRGRRKVVISTITPVAIRQSKMGANAIHRSPTSEALISTISSSLPLRLGLSVPMNHVQVEVVRADTRPIAVELGGKWGTGWGWDGEVEVVTNAIGHWLLAVAGMIGLGGRTAVGFGRVRVREG